MEHVSEKQVVEEIKHYLKSLQNCFFFKEHGGMYGSSGIPDIVACIDGCFFGFEVKTKTGKATKLQQAVIKKINRAGGTAGIVRSVEDVKRLIEDT